MKSVRTWKPYSLWGSTLLVVLVSVYTGLHNVFNERGNRLEQLQQIQLLVDITAEELMKMKY